jgi:hypothetical protein
MAEEQAVEADFAGSKCQILSTSGGLLGEWVYGVQEQENSAVEEEIPDMQSLTPMAIQRNWKTPSEFPMCPDHIGHDPLFDYVERLKFGTVFSRSEYGESVTVVAEQSAEKGSDLVSVLSRLGEGSVKDWAVTLVTVEDGKFVHESVRSYFSLQGALKDHCGSLGVSLTKSIDDGS